VLALDLLELDDELACVPASMRLDLSVDDITIALDQSDTPPTSRNA
jgi:hypothetical protein